MKEATIQLETLTCPSCLAKIRGALKKVKGTRDVDVLFNSSRVKLKFNEDETSIEEIERSIEKLGYEVIKSRIK